MADHQAEWMRILGLSATRQSIYAGVVTGLGNQLSGVQAALSPQGEATDQIVQIGVDLTPVAGARATKEIMAMAREVTNEHEKAIAIIENGRNRLSAAMVKSFYLVERIKRAAGDVGNL
jgi:hypothetical protein